LCAGYDFTSRQAARLVLPRGSAAAACSRASDPAATRAEPALTFEIAGKRFCVPAGSIQINPPGVPHRNWNEGSEDVHLLSFNTPLPNPDRPIAYPVEAP
jgi:hypothetical protein